MPKWNDSVKHALTHALIYSAMLNIIQVSWKKIEMNFNFVPYRNAYEMKTAKVFKIR